MTKTLCLKEKPTKPEWHDMKKSLHGSEQRSWRERKSMPLFERVNEIFRKHGFTVTAIVLAAGTVVGAVVEVISNSLKSLAEGIGKVCKILAKKQRLFLPAARARSWVSFPNGRTGHLIFGGAHLPYNSFFGRRLYGKVSQTQPLTLPNKQTCQKNCSHQQGLVYVVTCGRWSEHGGGGWGGRWLSQTLRFHCRLVD